VLQPGFKLSISQTQVYSIYHYSNLLDDAEDELTLNKHQKIHSANDSQKYEG
jgi:hypothetical protein